LADTIPYSNVGTIAPTPSFVASATGVIMGYFAGFSAADTDYIRMCDDTTNACSTWTFDNQTTIAGTSFNFGSVHAGDILEFQLYNQSTNHYFSSNPLNSDDHINHAFATAYSDTGNPALAASIPAGMFVGMEDLGNFCNGCTDLDYNDDQFVFTNVATTATPEPATTAALGLGLAGLAIAARRRIAIK
jgi:hypothetical protein